MYNFRYFNQEPKPGPMMRFVMISSAIVFTISILGISFLIVGLVALVSGSNEFQNVKSTEIKLGDIYDPGSSYLIINVTNAGHLVTKTNNFTCQNDSILKPYFEKCRLNFTNVQNQSILVKMDDIKFACNNDEKEIVWSLVLNINSSSIKFNELYLNKIFYSIKICTQNIEGFSNKLSSNPVVQVSGIVKYQENDNIIEKVYENCNFLFRELNNSTKSCILTRYINDISEKKSLGIENNGEKRTGLLVENLNNSNTNISNFDSENYQKNLTTFIMDLDIINSD